MSRVCVYIESKHHVLTEKIKTTQNIENNIVGTKQNHLRPNKNL